MFNFETKFLLPESSTTLLRVILNVRQSDRHPDSLRFIIITQILWNAVLCRKDGYFRTVGFSLKFHPSAFVVHSKGREDKQVHMYKEIIPRLRVRSLLKHRAVTLGTLGFGIKGQFGLGHFCCQLGFLFHSTLVLAKRTVTMQLPTAHRFFAVYLTLFGYVGEVYAGTVLMNSNAIKNVSGDFGSKGADTVSPSPRTSPPGSGTGHKSIDAQQVISCVKVNFTRYGRIPFWILTTNVQSSVFFNQIIAVRCVHGRWRLCRRCILQWRQRCLSALPQESKALRTGFDVLHGKPLQQW